MVKIYCKSEKYTGNSKNIHGHAKNILVILKTYWKSVKIYRKPKKYMLEMLKIYWKLWIYTLNAKNILIKVKIYQNIFWYIEYTLESEKYTGKAENILQMLKIYVGKAENILQMLKIYTGKAKNILEKLKIY